MLPLLLVREVNKAENDWSSNQDLDSDRCRRAEAAKGRMPKRWVADGCRRSGRLRMPAGRASLISGNLSAGHLLALAGDTSDRRRVSRHRCGDRAEGSRYPGPDPDQPVVLARQIRQGHRSPGGAVLGGGIHHGSSGISATAMNARRTSMPGLGGGSVTCIRRAAIPFASLMLTDTPETVPCIAVLTAWTKSSGSYDRRRRRSIAGSSRTTSIRPNASRSFAV